MEDTLLKALYEAGEILMNYHGKISEYKTKESQSSIVTVADSETEQKIMEIITHRFPNHNLIGEETGFQQKNSEFTWVVDPLDGTSNFAAGLPWFGVIICVLKNNVPVMAGCYIPFSLLVYFAEKGKGATLNDKKISVTDESELKNILAAYSLDYSEIPGKTEQEAKIIGRLVQQVRNLRSTNCILDFCYTADGKLGACMNQTTKIWDIAGPVLIIEEAGGRVSDFRGNKIDFSVDQNNYDRNFTIVCSNKTLHPKVIALVNQ